MEALHNKGLICLLKKTKLFCTEVKFLEHLITTKGTEADPDKVKHILEWSQPQRAKDVCKFLRLLYYIIVYLLYLAEHTVVLSLFTSKDCNKVFLEWKPEHQQAFEAIKSIVTSCECLTSVNHNSGEQIYITTDTSDSRTRAVLSIGSLWKTVRPVVFESKQYNSVEHNYLVYEQELLAIVCVLQKQYIYLLRVHFHVYTNHCTLKYLDTQYDLSQRQV